MAQSHSRSRFGSLCISSSFAFEGACVDGDDRIKWERSHIKRTSNRSISMRAGFGRAILVQMICAPMGKHGSDMNDSPDVEHLSPD